MRVYLVELLGTFGLTLAVALSLTGGLAVATPIVAALTLGLFVYTIGPISGSHLNPAVTIGLWSIQQIKSTKAVGYILAQLIGALVALYLASIFAPAPSLVVSNALLVGLAELIGAFFFVFGITAVVTGKVQKSLSGVVVGGSLLLGITLASVMSNGVLNPAVALGIGSFNVMYLVGPILGAVLGAWTFRFVSK